MLLDVTDDREVQGLCCGQAKAGFSGLVSVPWEGMSQIGRVTEELSKILRGYMLVPNCYLLGMITFCCIEQTSWLKFVVSQKQLAPPAKIEPE